MAEAKGPLTSADVPQGAGDATAAWRGRRASTR